MGPPRQKTCPASASSTPSTIRMAVVLPAPLGADEPEHLALGDGEREVVQRHHVAVAARQSLQLQHVVHPFSPGCQDSACTIAAGSAGAVPPREEPGVLLGSYRAGREPGASSRVCSATPALQQLSRRD